MWPARSSPTWTAPPPGGRPPTAYELLRTTWEAEVFPRHRGGGTFQAFWNQTLHDGVAQVAPRTVRVENFNQGAVRLVSRASPPAEGTYSVVLYSKVGMPDAGHAYNPWLHELPDPITKVTWDNYAGLSPATARLLGVRDGDVVRLEAPEAGGGSRVLELPAFVHFTREVRRHLNAGSMIE